MAPRGAGAPPAALVRVLYNGADWTPRLACARGAQPAPGGACTLAAFEAQVDALIAPHASWADACFTSEPHVVHAGEHSHPTRAAGAGGAAAAAVSDVGPGAAPDDEANDVGPGRAIDEAPAGEAAPAAEPPAPQPPRDGL